MKKLLLLLSFLLIVNTGFNACTDNTSSSNSTQQFSEETSAAFQAAVDNALSSASVKRGISVAVYKDGYAVWTYAAGYSDGTIGTTTGTAMTEATPGYAYSITKTFISALILSQVEAGLYSLDDTVADLLYDQTDYGSFNISRINVNATVADLLKHTTGMPDYASNLSGLIAMCNPGAAWKPADILINIVNQNFSAANWTSRTYEYSNTNYVLLGMIAEHKGGKTLNTLLREQFITPLGMDAVLGGQDSVPSDIAHPYDDAYVFGDGTTPPLGSFTDFSIAIKGVNPALDYYIGVGRGTWAAGGIIATAEDLAIWGFELYDTDGNAVSTTVRTQIKNSAAADGSYGYGVSYNTFTYDDSTEGGKYGHGGSAPGYKTLMRYETNQRISVAIMTNANNTTTGTGLVDREALADDIFNAYKDNN